ncbi:MAG TPA: hypothetical protein ENI63_02045 [Candidatus Kaiserbacteria bacterium]|nr:hypothetical protein [Candidatus Kaiserbacteria bacterium]
MYHKQTKPNPKKDESARRVRNTLYWRTGGRQITKNTSCRDCVTAQKKNRAEMQKEKPAPYGKEYILNANIKCDSCKKDYELSKRKTKDTATK